MPQIEWTPEMQAQQEALALQAQAMQGQKRMPQSAWAGVAGQTQPQVPPQSPVQPTSQWQDPSLTKAQQYEAYKTPGLMTTGQITTYRNDRANRQPAMVPQKSVWVDPYVSTGAILTDPKKRDRIY